MVKSEKSSTLNEEILLFIKAEDANGLAPVKDDNAKEGQKIKFKAYSYGSPMLMPITLTIHICGYVITIKVKRESNNRHSAKK